MEIADPWVRCKCLEPIFSRQRGVHLVRRLAELLEVPHRELVEHIRRPFLRPTAVQQLLTERRVLLLGPGGGGGDVEHGEVHGVLCELVNARIQRRERDGGRDAGVMDEDTLSVPEREVLPVVVDEQFVVHRVVQRPVDDLVVREVESVVDANGPEVDGNEEREEQAAVNREEHDVEVVGQALDVAVHRVERRRVDERMVQPAVEPVDQHVREENEPHHGHGLVGVAVLSEARVRFRVPAHIGEEPRQREYDHDWDGLQGREDLALDLMFHKLGVVHQFLVEPELVREPGADEVEQTMSFVPRPQRSLRNGRRCCLSWPQMQRKEAADLPRISTGPARRTPSEAGAYAGIGEA
ncbi:hypothetical protein ON010_g5054 [Phytophthora cinnamomi]|nr:hypothetical protein ON010_g5054 [Phytophthora cinnamomi]